jgi:DNA polymerase II large subunit
MFDKLKDKVSEREVIKEEGIEAFYKAIKVGVDPKDLAGWLISMQMKAENYMEYTLAEFTTGCQVNNCDTIEKWT